MRIAALQVAHRPFAAGAQPQSFKAVAVIVALSSPAMPARWLAERRGVRKRSLLKT